MKNGRSLVSLAQELERQLHSKKDLIVPSTLVRHATDDLGALDSSSRKAAARCTTASRPWRVASWRTS
ncbi:MAG: hypothetical protein V5B44_04590 [Candidatus Accumulibacter necessarius]|uniref:hypothetical protein n=1 Tax=Candidatus Accumulibacter necessarius TaxID=2954386 RepID=UPI002FC2B842